jgi:hypothetical protein
MKANESPERKSPYLCVYASQLAASIGEHSHKDIAEAAEIMWERADAVSYKEAVRRNSVVTDDDVLEKATKIPQVSKMLANAAEVEETSTQTANKYAHLSKEFTSFAKTHRLDQDSVRVIGDALRKTSYTTYGNEQESHVFRHIRDVMGVDCVTDPTFYKIQGGVVRGPNGEEWPWYIGGKVDGVSSDRKMVIEIKNRVNKLYYTPANYEVVQVRSYLELLGVNKGILVECFKTRNKIDVNTVEINRSASEWERCMKKLQSFVEFVAALLYDEQLQNSFITASPLKKVRMVEMFMKN